MATLRQEVLVNNLIANPSASKVDLVKASGYPDTTNPTEVFNGKGVRELIAKKLPAHYLSKLHKAVLKQPIDQPMNWTDHIRAIDMGYKIGGYYPADKSTVEHKFPIPLLDVTKHQPVTEDTNIVPLP